MKLGSEVETRATSASLSALLARLGALAGQPTFALQRQRALTFALQPYVEYEPQFGLGPLPEEAALAHLWLFADYLPDDGQSSLIEQVRDTITTHVSGEERAWLDPFRHSHMDLLEVTAADAGGVLSLRSLGSGAAWQVEAADLGRRCTPGQVLLTRVIHLPDRTVIPGAALIMAASVGRAVLAALNDARRTMEAAAGSFELGEWGEFTKRFGHLLLWQFAQMRVAALIEAEQAIRYRAKDGRPFLYALALYDHHERTVLGEGFDQLDGWQAEPGGAQEAVRTWVRRDGAARATLTPVHVLLECESGERLDQAKHQLASAFGFSLHFCGESAQVPLHEVLEVSLEEEAPPPRTVVVSTEDEQALLAAFLETVYLEWADRPSPSLNGETPHHAVKTAEGRRAVEALIQAVEADDPAARRTGTKGYDYNRLRAHVGL